VPRIRTERKRFQRIENRRKKADVSRVRTKRERFQRTEKRREKTDVSRVRTERKRVQRIEKRRERAGASGARPERKKLQIPKARNSPFHGVGNGSFNRKASARGIQSLQRGDRHRGGNSQRQGSSSWGRSGT